jgi:hypothetical protein
MVSSGQTALATLSNLFTASYYSGPAFYALFIWRIWNECIMETCLSVRRRTPPPKLLNGFMLNMTLSLYHKFYVELNIAPYPALILSDNYCLWLTDTTLARACTRVDGGWATLIRYISRQDVANDSCHIKCLYITSFIARLVRGQRKTDIHTFNRRWTWSFFSNTDNYKQKRGGLMQFWH